MDCNQRFTAIEKRLDDVEDRLGSVETRLGNVEKGLGDLSRKIDTRFNGFAALVISLIIAVLGVWYLIDQRQEGWIQHNHVVNQTQIDRNNEANRTLLEQFDRRHSERFQDFQRQIDRIERNLD